MTQNESFALKPDASSDGVKVSTVTVTPQLAEKWLAQNTHNRPLTRKHVESLAGDLRAGRWSFNGDTIRFTKDGVLIDGQHRLAACVKAGIPFEALVVAGLNEDVFNTIDAGRPRSAGDTLALEGAENAVRLAATLRFIDTVASGRVAQRPKYTNSEMPALHEKYAGATDAVRDTPSKSRLVPFAVAAGLLFLFRQKDRQAADAFFKALYSGEGLSADSPIYMLRERLIANSAAKARVSSDYIAALVIKAFNFVRSGEKVKSLRWRQEGDSPEPFPQID